MSWRRMADRLVRAHVADQLHKCVTLPVLYTLDNLPPAVTTTTGARTKKSRAVVVVGLYWTLKQVASVVERELTAEYRRAAT